MEEETRELSKVRQALAAAWDELNDEDCIRDDLTCAQYGAMEARILDAIGDAVDLLDELIN